MAFWSAPPPLPCSRQPDKSLKSVISSNFSSSFPNLPRASCCTGLRPPDLLVGPPADELCQPRCLDFCHLLSWCSFCQSQDLTRLSMVLCQQSFRQRWLSPFCFRSLPGADPTWRSVTQVSCRPPPTECERHRSGRCICPAPCRIPVPGTAPSTQQVLVNIS